MPTKFNLNSFRLLEPQHFRLLTAIEMGMRNHEIVPLILISSISMIERGTVSRFINDLTRTKLVVYERGKQYDGYRLSNLGYDYLALRELSLKEVVQSVGNQIGVGKESDIYVGGDFQQNDLVLKFHRLGRTSFRKIKEKRDYHSQKQHTSWLSFSRISASKEFRFLSALYSHGFPVPTPINYCRHTVVMSLIDGLPLNKIQQLKNPEEMFHKLLLIIIRLAKYGLIHGDFNEFNIILQDDSPILIDFPQMLSVDHPNAEYYFNRDIQCLIDFFQKRYGINFNDNAPKLGEIERERNLDVELKVSGYKKSKQTDLIKAYDDGNFTVHLDSKNNDDVNNDYATKSDDEEDLIVHMNASTISCTVENDDDPIIKINEWRTTCETGGSASDLNSVDVSEDNNKELHIDHKSSSANTIKERLIQENRHRKKEKRRIKVKGKQNALTRERLNNQQVIKESIGWDRY